MYERKWSRRGVSGWFIYWGVQPGPKVILLKEYSHWKKESRNLMMKSKLEGAMGGCQRIGEVFRYKRERTAGTKAEVSKAQRSQLAALEVTPQPRHTSYLYPFCHTNFLSLTCDNTMIISSLLSSEGVSSLKKLRVANNVPQQHELDFCGHTPCSVNHAD